MNSELDVVKELTVEEMKLAAIASNLGGRFAQDPTAKKGATQRPPEVRSSLGEQNQRWSAEVEQALESPNL